MGVKMYGDERKGVWDGGGREDIRCMEVGVKI